jgi:hypothetical protein
MGCGSRISRFQFLYGAFRCWTVHLLSVFHQDLLLHSGPKSQNYSSTPCREFSIPTEISFLAISPLPYREIGFRVIAKLVGTVLVLSKTPKPDGSECQCFPFLSGISLSGNRHIRCRGSLAPRISEPRTPIRTCALSLPRRLLSPFYRESRDRDFKGRNPFALENPECRTPTSRDLVPRVPVAINGSDLFGKSLIAISTV